MFRFSSTKRCVAVVVLAAAPFSRYAVAGEIQIPRQPGIPPAAEAVLADFERHAQAILERSTAEITAKRAQAVQRLQAHLQARMQAADLDGALAIRQMIRSLEASAAEGVAFKHTRLWHPPTSSPVPQPGGPAYPAVPPPTMKPYVLPLPRHTLTAVAPPAIATDPGDLTAYRARIGERLYFAVRGDPGGRGGVWGTGLYTHDSTLASAAVHAGVLQPGESGVVLVTIVKGPAWFQGSMRNGVSSGDWNNTDGYFSAYLVERVPSGATYVAPRRTADFTYGYARLLYDPGTMEPHYQSVGQSFHIFVTGADDGPVWGTDCYTYDSDLSSAAVHAGVVPLGQGRIVRVTIEKGPARFVGSNRNNVATHDWDNAGGHYTAFRIQAVDVPGLGVTPTSTGDHVMVRSEYTGGTVGDAGTLTVGPTYGTIDIRPAEREPLPPVPLPDPGNLLAYRGLNGRGFYFRVTGRAGADFAVWGSDVYTDDSYLAMAAVHAGALRVGETGLLKVTILPGCDAYYGSVRNGVRTESYPAYPGSYRIERFQEQPVEDTSIRLEAPEVTIRGGGTVLFSENIGFTDAVSVPGTPKFSPYVIDAAGPDAIGSHPGFSVAGAVRDAPTATIDFSAAGVREVPGDTDMQSVNPGPGRAYYLRIKGRTDGQLWGSDVYTSDSSVGTAAVHAGVLKPGETGVVKVTIAPGQTAYESTSRNGVTSSNYRSWDVSYRVEKDDR